MADTTVFSAATFRPEATMAAAQNGLACWSRAWTRFAEGLMSAGMAQIDLARSLYATAPADWDRALQQPGSSREAAQHWLQTRKAKYNAYVGSCRRINDDLAESFFAAADILTGGLAPEPAEAEAVPLRSNVATAAAKAPVAQKAS